MILEKHDRHLIKAIEDLTRESGPIDADEELAAVKRHAEQMYTAAVEGQFPDGFVFDAKRSRRVIQFQLVYARLGMELMETCPPGMEITIGGRTYHLVDVRDRVSNQEFRALVRGERAIVAAQPGLNHPGAGFRWANEFHRFDLVADRNFFPGRERQLAEQRAAEAAQQQPPDGTDLSL